MRLNTLTHHTTETRFGKHWGRLVGDYVPPSPLLLSHTCEMCVNVWEITHLHFFDTITYILLIPAHYTFTQQPSQQHKTYKTHTFTRISAIFVFHYFPMLSYVLLCFPMFHGMFFKRTNRNSLTREFRREVKLSFRKRV